MCAGFVSVVCMNGVCDVCVICVAHVVCVCVCSICVIFLGDTVI